MLQSEYGQYVLTRENSGTPGREHPVTLKGDILKERLCTLRDREEWKQPSFGLLSPLDIVAEGSRLVSDSWPHERLQRNAKTDQRQNN